MDRKQTRRLYGTQPQNSLEQLDGNYGLTPYDEACTAQNQTTFSTAFYRANQEIADNETAVDAAPC
jgi:hypothetical protein